MLALGLAVQATYRAEKMINHSHQQMKEEEGRHIVAMDAFHVAKKRIQVLKKKLTEEGRTKDR